MDASKVYKKVKRKQAQFLKQEPDTDLRFQEDPSIHIFIGNGGLKNGVPREVLEHILNNTCHTTSKTCLEQLYLPPGKDYAFATFTNTTNASECLTSLNGVCVQDVCNPVEPLPPALLQGPPLPPALLQDPPLPPALLHGHSLHLFMSFINKIPTDILTSQICDTAVDRDQLPPGLLLLEDFVSIHEEEQLLKFFLFSSDGKTQPKLAPKITSVFNTFS